MRIENHPILTFPQKKKVSFTYNGHLLEGLEGEPIAAALHANGIKVLSHCHRQNRPRGLYCAIGNCSSCKMIVNGKANIRICMEPLQKDMAVSTQKGKGEIQ